MKKINKEIKSNKKDVIKYQSEETNEIMKFILILVGISLIATLLYFVTAKYLVKDKFQNETESNVEATINYDTVRAGNVFNRPYDSYYVFAYDSTSLVASYYASLLETASVKDKIYYLDLSLEINKQYIGEESNKKASNSSELSLVEPTLILIKDGKISKYYDSIAEIENALK